MTLLNESRYNTSLTETEEKHEYYVVVRKFPVTIQLNLSTSQVINLSLLVPITFVYFQKAISNTINKIIYVIL